MPVHIVYLEMLVNIVAPENAGTYYYSGKCQVLTMPVHIVGLEMPVDIVALKMTVHITTPENAGY